MKVIYENFMGNLVGAKKLVRIKEIIELQEAKLQTVYFLLHQNNENRSMSISISNYINLI